MVGRPPSEGGPRDRPVAPSNPPPRRGRQGDIMRFAKAWTRSRVPMLASTVLLTTGGLLAGSATTAMAEEPGIPACQFAIGQPPVTIMGTNGNDVIFGTAASDVIDGLGGNDTIF